MSTTEVADFLAHYGVKGMKWGVTKGRYQAMSKTQRKAQRTKEIEGARLRGAKGENFKNYSKAKANVSKSKAELKLAKLSNDPKMVSKKTAGLASAKNTLKKVKTDNKIDYLKGTSHKNGKELARIILLGDFGRAINVSIDQRRLLANS